MSTLASEHQTARWIVRCWTRVRIMGLLIVGLTLMTVGAALTLAVAVVTLFQARRIYAEWLIGPLAQIALWTMGVRLVVHQDQPFPKQQVVYISNHASTLDIFVLTAMRLPNTRFFLSGYLRRKFPPLGLLGYLAGVFWTVPQSFPEQRIEIFKRAERVLRKTKASVFLSPEGRLGEIGTISPFNKGAFHLATNLAAPIIPMFISIPREIDPGWGYNARPGVVNVYVQPPVKTDQWQLEELDRNRTMMREYFLELQTRYQGE